MVQGHYRNMTMQNQFSRMTAMDQSLQQSVPFWKYDQYINIIILRKMHYTFINIFMRNKMKNGFQGGEHVFKQCSARNYCRIIIIFSACIYDMQTAIKIVN